VGLDPRLPGRMIQRPKAAESSRVFLLVLKETTGNSVDRHICFDFCVERTGSLNGLMEMDCASQGYLGRKLDRRPIGISVRRRLAV
jgi:hypothetical protein